MKYIKTFEIVLITILVGIMFPCLLWGAGTCTNAAGNTYVFGGATDDPSRMLNDMWKYGALSKQNILDILNFQLDSTSVSAYTAAVMSVLIFAFIVVKFFAKCLSRCCKRRRKKQYPTRKKP